MQGIGNSIEMGEGSIYLMFKRVKTPFPIPILYFSSGNSRGVGGPLDNSLPGGGMYLFWNSTLVKYSSSYYNTY